LAWQFGQRNLEYVKEIDQVIYCKDLIDPIGTRRVDSTVEQKY